MTTIDELKEAYDAFYIDLNQWLATHDLTSIRNYKDYHDAQTWGQDYRHDQHYFESISRHKNTVFGVISLAEQIKAVGDRATKIQAGTLIDTLNVELRRLDNLLFTARERLKFYENIMRVMGNITWGSY